MGYGDYIPSGGHHTKKPLTKAQIRKMQEAYKKSSDITATVRALEADEQQRVEKDIDESLSIL